MIDIFKNVAFIGANHDGSLKAAGKHEGQWSSAEGVGRLFQADIFHGQSHIDEELTIFSFYDAVIVNFNSCHLELPYKLKQLKPAPFVIGLTEGDAQDIEICYDRKHRLLLREGIKYCDVFGSLQKTLIPFFEAVGGRKNVIWLPAPCEEESFYTSKDNNKNDRIPNSIVAYVEHGRSYDYTFAVLSDLGLLTKIYTIGEWDFPNETNYNLEGSMENQSDYETFCRMLKNYVAGIRMDCRYVDGRFTKSLAGMRCASVGSNRIEAQTVVFPDLTFDPVRGTNKAKEVLKKLYHEKEFWQECVDKAFTKLIRVYSPDRLAKTVKDQLCRFV